MLKTKKSKLIAVLVLCIIWAACSFFSYIQNPPHLKDFGKTQALADYDQMWNIIEENFAALDAADRILGTDYREIKVKYRSRIEDMRIFSFKKFNDILLTCLYEYKGFAHIALMDTSYYDMVMRLAQAEESYASNFPAFDPEKSAATYAFLNRCGQFGQSEKKRYNASGTNLSFDVRGNTAYIKSNGLMSHEDIENDRPAVEKFLSDNKDAENLVIDITDSFGGSTSYWSELFVKPLLKEPVTTHGRYVLFKTPVDAASGSVPIEQVYELPLIVKEDLENLNYAYYVDGYTINPIGQPNYSGNIYLLVSERNGSAADEFAIFCRDTGFATAIGNTTKGNAPIVEPGYFCLEESGLWIRLQTDYTTDSTGRFNCEFGTEPDIFSDPGESAWMTYLRVKEGRKANKRRRRISGASDCKQTGSVLIHNSSHGEFISL